jgi:WD40 repeat protein
MSTIDEGKRPYTLFQGHSGPVYSAAFSPFSDFLLSSSSDSTSKTSRHHYFTSVVNPFILNIYTTTQFGMSKYVITIDDVDLAFVNIFNA